ncbi:MAG: type II toxin-antitoxin system VapC family toxin [Acidobacteria bacterium]|nr:type II toxin-antitoxin system VapC family toxin [Acidobacteriota bacterium]
MILDSSALVAVVLAEPAGPRILAIVKAAAPVGLGAPTLAETLLVLARRLGGDPGALLAELLRELDIEVIPFAEEHSRVALDAWLRFGKGRHPAALNFGDCFTYATAVIANQPLLYIGDDFSQTDVVSA